MPRLLDFLGFAYLAAFIVLFIGVFFASMAETPSRRRVATIAAVVALVVVITGTAYLYHAAWIDYRSQP